MKLAPSGTLGRDRFRTVQPNVPLLSEATVERIFEVQADGPDLVRTDGLVPARRQGLLVGPVPFENPVSATRPGNTR
jgi:hypothetical protein